MSIYDILFLICFFIAIGILLYKIFNILNLCTLYDLKKGIMLFIIFYIAYGLCFVTSMISISIAPDKIILINLFDFINWLQLFNVLFIFIEGLFVFNTKRESNNKPYSPEWYWNSH